jgi:RNA polymerase sigma factor (sigma-70 family)
MIVGDSDEALIGRYARGEVAAFDVLYRRHEMRIWRYLDRNLRNRATSEELLQEVWLAVARDAPRYKPTATFSAWLFSIAHHRMIDWIRANRRYVSLEALGSEPESAAPTPVAAAMTRDQAGALIHAISQLPGEQRDVFLLQAEGDLSVEEIATITTASFETTKSRLRYAKTKLRELLQEFA